MRKQMLYKITKLLKKKKKQTSKNKFATGNWKKINSKMKKKIVNRSNQKIPVSI